MASSNSSLSERRAALRLYAASALHPLLFAIYLPLALYLENVHAVSVRLPLGVLLSTAGLILCSELLLFRLTGKPAETAVALSASIILFILYRHLFGWINLEWLRFGAWFCVNVGVVVAIARMRRIPPDVTTVLNLVGLLLLFMPIAIHGRDFLSVGKEKWRDRSAAPRKATDPEVEAGVGRSETAKAYPDIYLILVDEYGRDDVLREHFEAENEPFLEELRSLGFQVLDQSYGNYSWTMCAIPSLLNLDYIDHLVEPPISIHRTLKTFSEPRLFDLLTERGYKSWVIADRVFWIDDLLKRFRYPFPDDRRSRALHPYLACLLDATPLTTLRRRFFSSPEKGNAGAALLRRNLSALGTIARDPRPTFTYLHLLAPHSPFILHADGSERPEMEGLFGTRFPIVPDRDLSPDQIELFRTLYADQVAGLNRHLLPALKEVLRHSEKPPIIILQADHGPRAGLRHPGSDSRKPILQGQNGPARNPADSLAILNAVYLPDESTLLPSTSTPLNTFRSILSRYLDAPLDPLPERSFLTAEHDDVFEFNEVFPMELSDSGGSTDPP